MIHLLFPIPVGFFDHSELLADCLAELSLCSKIANSPSDNVWRILEGSAFNSLKSTFERRAKEVAESVGRTESFTVKRGWLQSQRGTSVATPHTHPWDLLVAIYYLKVPIGSGDLLLQDPSAGSMWASYDDPLTQSGGNVFKRISPYPGLLVVHPGHIVHSTLPNTTASQRLCFATDFTSFNPNYNDYSIRPEGLV
jgi:hypothetical protein